MSATKNRRKPMVSKAIPVKFNGAQAKLLSDASNKSGMTQADIIRVGSWLLSSMSPDDMLKTKLRFVKATT